MSSSCEELTVLLLSTPHRNRIAVVSASDGGENDESHYCRCDWDVGVGVFEVDFPGVVELRDLYGSVAVFREMAANYRVHRCLVDDGCEVE